MVIHSFPQRGGGESMHVFKGREGIFFINGDRGIHVLSERGDGDPFISLKGGGESMHVFKGGMVIH